MKQNHHMKIHIIRLDKNKCIGSKNIETEEGSFAAVSKYQIKTTLSKLFWLHSKLSSAVSVHNQNENENGLEHISDFFEATT